MVDPILRGKNTLAIEDDRQMRLLIRNLLYMLGASDVVEASDGAEALSIVKSFRPHMIVCDLMMKPMSGLEFVRRLRGDKANQARFVPVIMVTAHADLDNVALARDAGVTEFMAKPLSAAGLEKRIQRMFNDPRPFVLVDDFVGPDRRRRRANGDFGGRERRMAPPQLIPVDAAGARLG
ncbi:MAG TPA: response regulator [Rhodospirillales bacterium]